MEQIVAFDWTDTHIRVAVGQLKRNKAVVWECFVVDLPEPVEQDSRADHPTLIRRVGEAVAAALKQKGIARAEAFVALSRRLVEIQPLELPPAPADELPDLVRFQAPREFTTWQDGSVVDFLPNEGKKDQGTTVLAASASGSTLTAIRSACESAQLRPRKADLRASAMAALTRVSLPMSDVPLAIVYHCGDEYEISVVRDGQLVFLRNLPAPAAEAEVPVAWLVGEIRRTLAAARNQVGIPRVEQILLCDEETLRGSAQGIEESLEIETLAWDPWDTLQGSGRLEAPRPEKPGQFASVLGLLLGSSDTGTAGFNFLQPRRREEKLSTQQKMRVPVLAAVAILLVVALFFMRNVRNLDSQISDLETTLSEINSDLDRFGRTRKEEEMITEWLAQDVTWLDELARLSSTFAPERDVWMSKLTLSSSSRSEVPEMLLDGRAQDVANIEALEERLADGGRRHVRRGSQHEVTDKEFPQYPTSFEETLLLEPSRSREDYSAVLKADLASFSKEAEDPKQEASDPAPSEEPDVAPSSENSKTPPQTSVE